MVLVTNASNNALAARTGLLVALMPNLETVSQELDKLVPVFDEFTRAMQMKLSLKVFQGSTGWDDPAWTIEMATKALNAHVEKGDLVDVANFAMFIWFKQQESTS